MGEVYFKIVGFYDFSHYIGVYSSRHWLKFKTLNKKNTSNLQST